MARNIISFSAILAGKVGFENAGFLQDIAYWIDYNKTSGTNFFDGRYWSFSTQDELCKRHPYWTRRQIQRIIKNCKDNGWLLVGNFSENSYDHTNWYSISDEIYRLALEDTTPQTVQSCSPQTVQSCSPQTVQSCSPQTVQSLKENNVNKKMLNNKSVAAKPQTRPRFSPPTVEAVKEYCIERKNGIDAEHFVDHYQARGWKYNGGQKMKDWKAAVRTWEQRDKKERQQKQQGSVHGGLDLPEL